MREIPPYLLSIVAFMARMGEVPAMPDRAASYRMQRTQASIRQAIMAANRGQKVLFVTAAPDEVRREVLRQTGGAWPIKLRLEVLK